MPVKNVLSVEPGEEAILPYRTLSFEIDRDLARRLEVQARRSGTSVDKLVNEALRRRVSQLEAEAGM